MRRANSLEKTLMLEKIEGKRRRRQQRMRWLDSITDSMDMNLSKFQDIVKDRGVWCAAGYGSQRVGHDLVTKQQQQHSLGISAAAVPSLYPNDLLMDCLLWAPRSQGFPPPHLPKAKHGSWHKPGALFMSWNCTEDIEVWHDFVLSNNKIATITWILGCVRHYAEHIHYSFNPHNKLMRFDKWQIGK